MHITCPTCFDSLMDRSGPILACEACDALYPVLGGIPILLQDVMPWVAAHSESILSALALNDSLRSEDLELIRSIAELVPSDLQLSFARDWDLKEEEALRNGDHDRLELAPGLEAVLSVAPERCLYGFVKSLLSRLSGPMLEVGAGVGVFTETLAGTGYPVTAVDNNLRALLRRKDVIPGVDKVVADASYLPFADDSFGAVVALNLVDLLDQPEDFVTEANRVLREDGMLLVSTPDPSLGVPDGDRSRLVRIVEECGFSVVRQEDGLLWARQAQLFEVQIFSTQVVCAQRLADAG